MLENDINDKKNEKKQNDLAADSQSELNVSDICATKEIEIEEVAIDGICGVY